MIKIENQLGKQGDYFKLDTADVLDNEIADFG